MVAASRPAFGDITAGISLAGLLLPEAVAYAGIAGLAPQHAIFAAVSGLVVYAVFGASRFAVVSPTSASAAIIAASVASAGATTPGARLTITLAIVLLAGIWFLAASLLKLGFLADFISRPVLRGFGLGLGATIIIKQMPLLVGIPSPPGAAPIMLLHMLAALPTWNLPSLVTGLVALAGLLALARWPMLPRGFLVLCAGAYAAVAMHLADHGVHLVGAIDFARIKLAAPSLGYDDWLRLAAYSLPMFLMIYAESWGSIRGLALRHGDTVDANRELRALGLANIGAALVQGMPVGAGFSASTANEQAGAQTRVAGVMAALCVAAMALFGGDFIARLPTPVLAAVVIAALLHTLNPRPLLQLLKIRRDFAVAAVACIAVLAAGVLNGMLAAIGLSLVVALARFSQPQVSELGALPDGYNFASLQRQPTAKRLPGIAIYRPDRALFFANAARALGDIFAATTAPTVRIVIVSLEESGDIDSTAAEEILDFATSVTARGQILVLARIKDELRDVLARTSATAALPFSETRSVNDAASFAKSWLESSDSAKG